MLDEELTVRENLKNRAGLYQHIDKTWLNDLVELTGLSGFLGAKVRDLIWRSAQARGHYTSFAQ